MVASIKDCTVLSNNVEMPWLGLGVFKMKEGDESENAHPRRPGLRVSQH